MGGGSHGGSRPQAAAWGSQPATGGETEHLAYGELLTLSAIVMCLLFVTADIGRPGRFWHLLPCVGHLNFPRSLLAWDVLVLNVCFLLNLTVVTHILHRAYHTPRMRRNRVTLNIGCLATYAGCSIEKGMGLIIPGLTPDTLGEISQYAPSLTELRVAAGVFALGFLVFTLMLKMAVPISLGEFQRQPSPRRR